jgi:hypothetical protein
MAKLTPNYFKFIDRDKIEKQNINLVKVLKINDVFIQNMLLHPIKSIGHKGTIINPIYNCLNIFLKKLLF